MGRIPFSDQLRSAIEACGPSRYALARSAGISESALSRFMTGERSLTVDSLDKLADALGLEIVITVQKVPRPSPRGRRPKKGNPVTPKMTKSAWLAYAKYLAKDAFTNHLPSRRGVWFIEDQGALCLYNNNPYAFDVTLRDRELAEFRRRMKVEGIKELAYSTYPLEGEEKGYTYALLIDAGLDREDWVVDTMKEIMRTRQFGDRKQSI